MAGWYIYLDLYIYDKKKRNVGKYTMYPLGTIEHLVHPAIFPYMKTTIALVDNPYPLSLLMFDLIVGKKHCQPFILYKSLLNFTKPAYNDTTWRINPT